MAHVYFCFVIYPWVRSAIRGPASLAAPRVFAAARLTCPFRALSPCLFRRRTWPTDGTADPRILLSLPELVVSPDRKTFKVFERTAPEPERRLAKVRWPSDNSACGSREANGESDPEKGAMS